MTTFGRGKAARVVVRLIAVRHVDMFTATLILVCLHSNRVLGDGQGKRFFLQSVSNLTVVLHWAFMFL